jgi:lysophospholipase L1-like esterase
MKRSLACAVAAAIAIAFLAAAAVSAEKAKAPEAPKIDPNLPKVLIIGDSISIGYTPAVQKLLAGKVNVIRIPGNGQHTATGLAKLKDWLGAEKWDVIHFNWGLWDLCYHGATDMGARDKVGGKQFVPLEEYEKNLRELAKRLKATGAKLIWATTTPVPDGDKGRNAGDELRYNAVAEKIMKENGVAVDDLHAAVLPRLKDFQSPGNVHFNAKGSEFLAEQVAASILKTLQAPAK